MLHVPTEAHMGGPPIALQARLELKHSLQDLINLLEQLQAHVLSMRKAGGDPQLSPRLHFRRAVAWFFASRRSGSGTTNFVVGIPPDLRGARFVVIASPRRDDDSSVPATIDERSERCKRKPG